MHVRTSIQASAVPMPSPETLTAMGHGHVTKDVADSASRKSSTVNNMTPLQIVGNEQQLYYIPPQVPQIVYSSHSPAQHKECRHGENQMRDCWSQELHEEANGMDCSAFADGCGIASAVGIFTFFFLCCWEQILSKTFPTQRNRGSFIWGVLIMVGIQVVIGIVTVALIIWVALIRESHDSTSAGLKLLRLGWGSFKISSETTAFVFWPGLT